VLDPFLGSGTTSLAAKNNSRNSIGYEINKDFIALIKEKLNCNQTDTSGTSYEFLSDFTPFDQMSRIAALPYVFDDPHKFDKKTDPKKLRFGSRIDSHTEEREEHYSVKRVLSPEMIILDNN
jgi:site-specific DNA-methyltransferase (adenine-specific)